MNDSKLVIGLPAGSLADPNRGGSLANLLKDAGFPAKGYDKGGPSTFPLESFLVGWDGRPQEFGSQLFLGEIDMAIGGNDWIRERQLEYKYEYDRDVELIQVLPLNRGAVRIVIIGPSECAGNNCDEWFTDLLENKPLVTMVGEMPYLALEWFQRMTKRLGFAQSHSAYSIQKFKTPPKIDKGLVIYESWGKTEAKVKNGSADFGIEITQTGSAIQNYGLSIITEVMQSEAGVWASPTLKDDPEKYDMAKMLLLNLYGSVYAENKVLALFNARKDNVQAIVDYLASHKLFADEPTINYGESFAEFSVQLNADDAQLPLAKVRYELAKMGATGIDTIPLESSIPGIGAVEF